MFWCCPNPNADELRWQAKIREEKLDEGAILYFEEEEEEKKEMEKERERFALQQLKDRSPATKPDLPTKCWTNALPTSTTRPLLWRTNPCRPYIMNERYPEVIDLTKGESHSDDD